MGNTRPSPLVTALMAANFFLSVAALGGVVWMAQRVHDGECRGDGQRGGFSVGLRPGSGGIEATVGLNAAGRATPSGSGDADPAAGSGDRALPLAEQVDRLRQELAQVRDQRDAAQKSFAEVEARVKAVEEKAGQGGTADLYAETVKQSVRWQVAQLKKRLQLRPDQLDPVKKLFEEQYTKMYAEYYGGDEDSDLDYQEIAARQQKANEEYEQKFEAMLDNWQVNEYRKMKEEQARSMSNWGATETQSESSPEGQ